MRPLILASSLLFLVLTFSVSAKQIIDLKNCYNPASGTLSIFEKSHSNFNINLASKKITETTIYDKGKKESANVWNIINYSNGLVEAVVDGYGSEYKKSLLIVLIEEKTVLYLNHSGANYIYKCKS